MCIQEGWVHASAGMTGGGGGGVNQRILALGLIVWGVQARLLIVGFSGGGGLGRCSAVEAPFESLRTGLDSGHAIGARHRRTFNSFSTFDGAGGVGSGGGRL